MCNPPSVAAFPQPPGGFPRLGTRVKQGDILGYVTPPIAAIDVSDMRQRQGELDQQISIVERRFARYEQLAPSGAISRTQLEDTRLELEGLRDRRASIEKSRREPEALIAPVAGVIAEGSAVAGQIVQPSSVVFNIIDPSRLWVEALSFESLEPSRGARASTYTGKELRPHLSRHRLRRSQPIGAGAFCRDGRHGGPQGRPVPDRAGHDRRYEGGPCGAAQQRRSRLERPGFRLRARQPPSGSCQASVRTEPLDGDRVLIVSGFTPGKRIVSQGADLLDHVR